MPYIEEKDRKIIPRWRNSLTTISKGELDSVRLPGKFEKASKDFITEKIRDWKKHKTLSFAADLIGSAFVLGYGEEAIDAAQFILSKGSRATDANKQIARKILTPGFTLPEIPADKPEQRIHLLRMRLREEPRNCFTLADLALEYTTLGQLEKAKRAINMALSLAPSNRFILRMASRFHIHQDDPEQAYSLLRKAESIKTDPWLLAAEIAVSQIVGRTSLFIKAGKGIITDTSVSPAQKSELASALGTLELQEGSFKKARKLFSEALSNPTENSVAQVSWASRRESGLDVELIQNYVERSPEASAWEFYSRGEWEKALNSSIEWFKDQPFSSRPPTLCSFIATMALNDYDQALQLLEPAIAANPDDTILLNNLTYALACIGQVDKAKDTLSKIDESVLDKAGRITIKATRGLIHFREGDSESGRRLYNEAIKEATGEALRRYKIMASIVLAREETISKSSFAQKAKEFAISISKGETDPLFGVLLRQLETGQVGRGEK